MNSYIECDTERLKDAASSISDDIAELEVAINKFFSKINNIPTSKEWTGDNARTYADLALLDKEIYLNYIDGIKSIVKEMQLFAEKLEDTINQNEEDAL